MIIDPNAEYNGGLRIYTYLEFVQAANVFREKRFCILVSCDDDAEYEAIMQLCYRLGGVTVIIDESHLFADYPIYNKLLRMGRHRGIKVITVSHSAFDFGRINRALFTAIISFRINETYENRFIKESVGDDLARKIQRLKQGQFIFLKGSEQSVERILQ